MMKAQKNDTGITKNRSEQHDRSSEAKKINQTINAQPIKVIRRPEQEPVVAAKRVKLGKAIAETARVRPVKNVKLKTKPSAIEKKVRKHS